MSEIKVSVWCLAYNHEKYIRKTLEGFVNQKTNFDYEIIIHDDCSTDNTVKIIEEYKQKYSNLIKTIYQKENQYSKRVDIFKEYVFPLIKGEYIAICEGDDYWCDEYKLQKQADILDKNKNCSVSVHRVNCCNEDGTYNDRTFPSAQYGIKESKLIKSEEAIELMFEKGSYPFHTSSYFFRKNVILDIKNHYFDFPSRDIFHLYSFSIAGDFYYFDEPMSIRRLESVGSYNETKKKWNKKQLAKETIEEIDADLRFDLYSDKKNHKYICHKVYNNLVSVGKIEPKKIKEIMKNYKLSFTEMKNYVGINETIKHYFSLYFSCIAKLIRNIKW